MINARDANKEDKVNAVGRENALGYGCKGRFRSQALTDEAALMACMAYVDLNSIRAKLAKTPETSKNTSIQKHVIAP